MLCVCTYSGRICYGIDVWLHALGSCAKCLCRRNDAVNSRIPVLQRIKCRHACPLLCDCCRTNILRILRRRVLLCFLCLCLLVLARQEILDRREGLGCCHSHSGITPFFLLFRQNSPQVCHILESVQLAGYGIDDQQIILPTVFDGDFIRDLIYKSVFLRLVGGHPLLRIHLVLDLHLREGISDAPHVDVDDGLLDGHEAVRYLSKLDGIVITEHRGFRIVDHVDCIARHDDRFARARNHRRGARAHPVDFDGYFARIGFQLIVDRLRREHVATGAVHAHGQIFPAARCEIIGELFRRYLIAVP